MAPLSAIATSRSDLRHGRIVAVAGAGATVAATIRVKNDLMFAKRAVDELGYQSLKFSYSLEKHLSLIHQDERELFHLAWQNFIEEAEIAGFLWLSDSGKLTPKLVFPVDQSEKLKLDADLTRRERC